MSRRDADAYQGKEGPSGEGRVKCAGIGAVRSHAWAGWSHAVLSTPSSFVLPTNAAPYDSDPAASAAIAATMEKLDWAALLRRVDEGYCTWRQPSLLLFGTSGQWLS